MTTLGNGSRSVGTTSAGRKPREAAPERPTVDGTTTVTRDARPRGFVRRYRLPLLLAVVALCLYTGSILYILYVRGPIA